MSTLPTQVGAFWPFDIARGEDGGTEPPILHDGTIALLKAAVNSDPNPSKGEVEIAMSEGSALIANSGPEGTLPYREGKKNGQISMYTVREGDSLSEIADMFGVSMNTILWANNVESAKLIRPGMELLILPVSGVQHKVGKGETLAGIAKKYDADADEIALFNGLESGAGLTAGSSIIIPGGEVVAKTTKTATAAKKTGSSSALPALSGYFGNPVPGGRITQGLHGYNGIDVGAPNGTPIYAAAAGKVLVAKSDGGYNGGYGNYVVISHDNGTQSLYAHMSRTATSVGATVEKGELIGYIGITGKATGYHLHFEVRGAKNPLAR